MLLLSRLISPILVLSSATSAFSDAPADPQTLLTKYCVTCHSQAGKAGGLVLEGLNPNQPAARPDAWEKVIRKLRAGEMPPVGMPRPETARLTALTNSLIGSLDAAAERAPFAGRTVIRRLNRTEYSNSIRDLLALDLPFWSELPADGTASGFDNIGDALSISPVLLERYVKLARKIADVATGVGDNSPVTDQYRPSKTQAAWQGEEMPFGTRGGISVSHYFPANGEYALRAFLDSENGQVSPTEGVRFFQTRIHVEAGLHTFIATFPDEFAVREGPTMNNSGAGGRPLGGPVDVLGSAIRPVIDFLLDGQRTKRFEIRGPNPGEAAQAKVGPPVLERVEISGPYNATGVSETPSRNRIFVCHPARVADEAACADRILATLLRRAYRRDVDAADLHPYLVTYRKARVNGSFNEGIAAALRLLLVAPDFLFRLEIDPPGNAAQNAVYQVPDFELASRLSFFLWSSIPDDELLDTASKGRLRDASVLKQQVTRMLDDRKAESLVDNFAVQWLGLRAAADSLPDSRAYPEYDSALGESFRHETHLFLRSIIRENRSVIDLIDADYTFLDERLAKVYGVPGVTGPGFRRVSLTGQKRAGLLGEGSVLMMTSHTNKTSPVLRGNWILTNLLNSPPPPPPPGVPPLDESAVNGKPLTTRQQVERHRASAACSSCHARMDPLGFALENFDVIGRWRTRDAGGEIDPSGTLPNGEEVSGPMGLRDLLKRRSDDFVGATVARLMTFALGRQLEPQDQPAVRRILRDAKLNGYRFSELIFGIVNSVPFRMRQPKEPS